MTPTRQDAHGGGWGSTQEGHSPQAQLPPGWKSCQCREVTAVCRVRPRGGGAGGQVFRPASEQPLWGRLRRARAGLGTRPSMGLGGKSPWGGRLHLRSLWESWGLALGWPRRGSCQARMPGHAGTEAPAPAHCGAGLKPQPAGQGQGIPGTGADAPAGLWWGFHTGLGQHLQKKVWLGRVWG